MSLKAFNTRITDSSLTGGASTLVLQGKHGGGQPEFLGNVAADGDTVILCITDLAGNFEVSQCLVSIVADGTVTITRTPIVSSNSNAAVNFPTGIQKITNYSPGALELTLFNLTYNQAISASLTAMAADISDLKDAMTLLLDGGNP